MSVGCNGIEVPATRSFTAISLRVNVVSDGPAVVQIELFNHDGEVALRGNPFLVGTTPIVRNLRWPVRANTVYTAQDATILFSIFSPCASPKPTWRATMIVNYTCTVHLSADYETNNCPIKGVVFDPSPGPSSAHTKCKC